MNKEYLQLLDEISELKKLTLIGVKNVLTIEDASIFTGLSVKRIYSLTSTRQIPHYKREGSRILYFDKAELERWMKGYRVCTEEEAIQTTANQQLALHGI